MYLIKLKNAVLTVRILLVIFCFIPFYLSAQSSNNSKDNKSYQSIDQLISNINKVLVEEKKPGLMLSIVKKDSVLFQGGLGYADIESKRVVDSLQLFRLGSITKTFTSMAILTLVNEGKFELNSELKKIAPEIDFKNPWEDKHPVRIIHLLEHTAGFDDIRFKAIYNPYDKNPTTLEGVTISNSSLKSRWKPGERSSYANPDYAILGYLIEKYSGTDWDKYIKIKILDPLGMIHTNFNLRISPNNNYATPYKLVNGINKPIPFYSMYDGPTGSINTCAADMTKFLKFYLNSWKINDKNWLPVSILNEMEISHSTIEAKNGLVNGYGMGNSVTAFDAKVFFHGHNGGFPGYLSKFAYNRELGVGYAISNNNETDNKKIAKLITDFLTQDLDFPPKKKSNFNIDSIRPFLGIYKSITSRNEILSIIEGRFNEYKYEIYGEKLIEVNLLGETDTLFQVGSNTFQRNRFNTPTLLFTYDEDGNKIVVSDGDYYKKTNIYLHRFLQILFIFSLLSSFILLIIGFGYLFVSFFRKETRNHLKSFLFPSITAIIFLTIVFEVYKVFDNILLFVVMNTNSIALYISTILFAIFSIINFLVLYKNWHNVKGGLLKYYLLVTSLLWIYLSFLLYQNDWIGLKTWAY